jgi:hypothetical protein
LLSAHHYRKGRSSLTKQDSARQSRQAFSCPSDGLNASEKFYLNERTDIAFLPFGLDLFDKLVKACKAVRASLQSEQRALNTNTLASVIAQIPPQTAAARLAGNITSLTKPEAIQALTRLSPQEEARLGFLQKALQDLQANDPEKLIAQLNIRASRARALSEHLRRLESALSEAEVAAVLEARKEGRRKSEEAKRLREATFPRTVLPGTGGEQWKAMWDSSRVFSEQQAYLGKPFPVTQDGSKCVLCQQDLDREAVHRLTKFEETIKELPLEHDSKAESVNTAIAQNEKRRAALTEDREVGDDCPALASVSQQAQSIVVEIEARIKSLRESKSIDARKKMAEEAEELRARILLGKNEQTILDEIEKKVLIGETRILGGFLKNDEFGLGDRHALGLEQ